MTDKPQLRVFQDVEVYAKVGSADAVLIPNVLTGTKVSWESTVVDTNVMEHGDVSVKQFVHAPKVKVELPVSLSSKHVLAQLVAGVTFATTNAGTPTAGTMTGKGGLSCTPVVTLYIYPLWTDCVSETAYVADASNPDAWKIDVFMTPMLEYVYANDAQDTKKLTFNGTIDSTGGTFLHGAGIANPSA